MPAAPIVLPNAIALKIAPSSERFRRIHLLCPECGVVSVLQRKSSKKLEGAVDLFDEGEFQIDHKPGEGTNFGFLTGFDIQRKRNGLGHDYSRLEAASWLSLLLVANPLPEETRASIFELAQKSLDALDSGLPRHSVLTKALFVFSRDEGYPVVEDWARNANRKIANAASYILRTPLTKIECEPDLQHEVFTALCHYVEHHTHIHMPKD